MAAPKATATRATARGLRLALAGACVALVACEDFDPPAPAAAPPVNGLPTPPLVIDAGPTPDAGASTDDEDGG